MTLVQIPLELLQRWFPLDKGCSEGYAVKKKFCVNGENVE